MATDNEREPSNSAATATAAPAGQRHMELVLPGDGTGVEAALADLDKTSREDATVPRPAARAPRKESSTTTADTGSGKSQDNQAKTSSLVVLDAQQLRARHRAWERTLRTKGRSAAIERVDADVLATMERRCSRAMKRGDDLRLVLPSNDPDVVNRFTALAHRAGYTATLSVQLAPAAMRDLRQISDRHELIKQGLVHHAVPFSEHESERAHLNVAVQRAFNDRTVDEIRVIPNGSDTPASVYKLEDVRDDNGNRLGARWNNPRPISQALADIQERHLTTEEVQDLTDGVHKLWDELRDKGHYGALAGTEATALRNDVVEHLNSLAKQLGLDPLERDRSHEAWIQASDHVTATPHSSDEAASENVSQTHESAEPSADTAASPEEEAAPETGIPSSANSSGQEHNPLIPTASEDGAPPQPPKPLWPNGAPTSVNGSVSPTGEAATAHKPAGPTPRSAHTHSHSPSPA